MKFGRSLRKGFTLTELMVVCAVLAILAGAALPVAKTAVKREKEIELRRSLRLMREALDAYKRLADEGKIEVEDESEGYPPDLETLVKGVEVQEDSGGQPGDQSGGQSNSSFGDRSGGGSEEGGSGKKTIKFLRRIPLDPMTNSTDWGFRSYQDAPDSTVWGKENVYDVYTKSRAKALDGSKYADW
jgi:general secretion pathway protein G